MASVISHAVAGLALGSVLRPAQAPLRFWVLGAACAVLPDTDSYIFRLAFGDHNMLRHRGLTHSLPFALLLSGVIVLTAFQGRRWGGARLRLLLYFFLATASHGILDALTNGGSGIAFFAPVDDTRYFFPYRPIEVSPLSVRRFFSQRGLVILENELRWIWLPALVLAGSSWLIRRRLAAATKPEQEAL